MVGRKVKINGIEYLSIMEASRILNINRRTIEYRLYSINFNNYIFLDGEQKINREILNSYQREYRKNNSEKLKIGKKDSDKKYYSENNIEIKRRVYERVKEKRKSDITFRLKNRIRKNITYALKRNGFIKNDNTSNILGCSYNEFKLHLESKFEPWMNWNNYGKYNGELNYGWDIDHVIPQSNGYTEEEIYKLNHYTNLQPLCSKINRDIKREKVDY
jgi:hypothetical protein